MKNIPILLIYSRILIAIIFAGLTFCEFPFKNWILVLLMTLGLLTDVFDGIIARKLNISTEKLRILDSNVDQFFWVTILISVFYSNLDFLKSNYTYLIIILVLEISTYVLSFSKFGKTIATHSLLAKLWTISLLVFLIDFILHGSSIWPFYICFGIGVISRVEIILIISTLKKWVTDVPSIWVVSNINRGEEIKKNKWFNG
jgi:CDP-diacylglycerol--glycerol-3-phosphate 3-phosphatidyltransferase